MLIPYSIAVVTIIYVVCTLIDLFRQRVFERPYIMLVNRYTDTCLGVVRNMNNYVKRLFLANKFNHIQNSYNNVSLTNI